MLDHRTHNTRYMLLLLCSVENTVAYDCRKTNVQGGGVVMHLIPGGTQANTQYEAPTHVLIVDCLLKQGGRTHNKPFGDISLGDGCFHGRTHRLASASVCALLHVVQGKL